MSTTVSTTPTTVSAGLDLAALRRRVGWVGVVASALIVLQVPLYFVYDGAPPDGNILTRTLIGLLGVTCYLVWFVGLRDLFDRADPDSSWLSGVIHTAGLVWCAMVFVPQSMEAGAAISVDHDIDTTTEGPFAAAQYLMQGAISRLLMAAVLIALGIVVSRDRGAARLGRQVGLRARGDQPGVRAGAVLRRRRRAVLQRAGLGHTASMGALWSLWTLAVSISMVRRARR